ncbi:MAG: M23 family metallopeptidase [Nannocystaceae bacterium]
MSTYDPGPPFTMGSYEYGAQHDGRTHAGLDFLAPQDTPVPAAASGMVVGLGFDPTYGNLVIIQHTGATATVHRYTLYAHLSGSAAVLVGQRVSSGQTIGYVDMTGTGGNEVFHLHFELLHLDDPWQSEWQRWNSKLVHWQGNGVPLMLDNPEGRVNPLEELSWAGLDVYSAPRPEPARPRRGGGGGRFMAAAPF